MPPPSNTHETSVEPLDNYPPSDVMTHEQTL